jgi:hypothetical protein
MSTHAPYATLHDLPKYEKRAEAVGAPWFKDQETVKCSRGHDPVPYIACNSRTAPFATFHNVPKPAEHSALLPETTVEQGLFVEQPLHPTENSQLPSEHKHSTLFDTSGDLGHHATQPNMSMVHQAPWDRDEVHYKVQPRFPHGEDAPHYTSSHAPFATDSKR